MRREILGFQDFEFPLFSRKPVKSTFSRVNRRLHGQAEKQLEGCLELHEMQK